MAETKNRTNNEAISNRTANTNLTKIGFEVYQPNRSGSSFTPHHSEAAEEVDPEEAFVASVSSCHMLWFLSIAAKRGFCVDRYADAAEGVMARNAEVSTGAASR